MSHIIKWLTAALFALVLATIWDGPSELDAIEDVAAEVAALSGGAK
jgi:hypothetical protein